MLCSIVLATMITFTLPPPLEWQPPEEYETLTQELGVTQGPSGKETYYNLPMDGVVAIMRADGYTEGAFPYWVREDGVKMLGDFVMVAADLSIRPRGKVVETTLGLGIVCDTGTFVNENRTQIDIAVNW